MRVDRKPVTPVAPRGPAPEPPEDNRVLTERIVDATVDKTMAGTNRVSSSLVGFGSATAAYLSKMPSAVGDVGKSAVNLLRSETIGPNIKVVALATSPLWVGLGVVGAGLGGVAGALSGLGTGWKSHDKEKPREFTIDQAASKSWSGVREAVEDSTKGMVEATQEVRDKKLAPGEDPWDIPLPPFGRTAKTAAATVAGLVVGGIGGVAMTVALTAKGVARGVKRLFTKPSAGQALATAGSVVGAPVTGVLHGASRIIATPIKAAAAAWKEDSLKDAMKAAVKEGFQAEADRFPTAAGATVGAAAVAGVNGAASAVITTVGALGSGLKNAATDAELSLPGKALAAVGTVVGAPVAGVAHGVAATVTTPVVAAGGAWENNSLAEGVSNGVDKGHQVTKTFARTGGALAGGLAVGGISAVATTGAATVSQIGGGVVDAVTNGDHNVRGRALDAVGGVVGDTVATVGQGLGAVFSAPLNAAADTIHENSFTAGIRTAAQNGVRSVQAAARPSHMVEQVPVDKKD